MNRLIAAMVVAGSTLGFTLSFGGCRCHQGGAGPGSSTPIPRVGKPDYAAMVKGYNARVEPLVRLWASMVVRLKYKDEEGVSREEQFDGVVQYIAPSKALLTLRKFSQDFALLGSDGERYWWIELDKVRRATVGRHEFATPERLESAGLPVHPLDLVELLALTPLAAEGDAEWSGDGKWIVVTQPGRNGKRRLFIDPSSYEPVQVQVVGARGEVVAGSTLTGFEKLALKGATADAPRPRIPTRVIVEAGGGATRLVLDISQQQDDPARFRPTTFNFEKLSQMLQIENIRDLDQR